MTTIDLSDTSIHDLTELCRLVERRNPKNEISLNMSRGIAEYITDHRVVTEPQAKWLSRNADFYRVRRPPELLDVEIEKKSDNPPPPLGFQEQIIQALGRIVKLLSDLPAPRLREKPQWTD
jgi:hypothetical protein